jgi:predicted RNase H-like HicB family nuclease
MAKRKMTEAERAESDAFHEQVVANARRTRELAERAQAKLDAQTAPAPGTMRLTAAITRSGNEYVARCLEVDVLGRGHTVDRAKANLREALERYFEHAPKPEPSESPIIAPVDVAA